MTGFAQVKGQINGRLSFSLSLKSVNHRFLDLHFRMPSESDGLEMKLRRLLKEKIARGHVELTLSLDRGGSEGFNLNRELVGGYIKAFRAAAAEFGLAAEPDLNVILRMPGAMDTSTGAAEGELEAAVLPQDRRSTGPPEQHARGRRTRHRTRTARAHGSISRKRAQVSSAIAMPSCKATSRNCKSRMQELIGAQVDQERLLQEAALLVDRSDIQEELVRLRNPCPALPRTARRKAAKSARNWISCCRR